MGFDVVTMGRVSMDLYSRQIGADFAEVESFDAMIGGSPSNIAIGTSRLGADSAVLTAVGPDEIGRFVLSNFAREGVSTDHVRTVEGTRTGLAILGVQPPDHFPLTFYRENPADIHLTCDDVDGVPFADTRIVALSGTGLSRGTCKEATLYAGERAAGFEKPTVLIDLDLRPDQWVDRRGYGTAVRALLEHIDVAIGTEEEFHAALAPASEALDGSHLSDGARSELDGLMAALREHRPDIVFVLKRGPRGVTVMTAEGDLDVEGYPVEVLNTVGAGDAFASGLIHGMLQDWDWHRTARFANACGAIEVTRHGCSSAMPTVPEVMDFVEDRGGL